MSGEPERHGFTAWWSAEERAFLVAVVVPGASPGAAVVTGPNFKLPAYREDYGNMMGCYLLVDKQRYVRSNEVDALLDWIDNHSRPGTPAAVTFLGNLIWPLKPYCEAKDLARLKQLFGEALPKQ